MKLKVRCDGCNELMATIDTDTIKLPLTGDMFEAAEQMYERPFHPSNTFEQFRCPYGPHDYHAGHKPFHAEGEFLTEHYRKWKIGEQAFDYPITAEEMRQKQINEAWVEPAENGKLIKAAKDYPCRYCDKVFKHKSSRSRHERQCKTKKRT